MRPPEGVKVLRITRAVDLAFATLGCLISAPAFERTANIELMHRSGGV